MTSPDSQFWGHHCLQHPWFSLHRYSHRGSTILYHRVIMHWTTHIVLPKKPVTPTARWVCSKIHCRFTLPPFPPWRPLKPTPMRASTWHRQRRIRLAGWAVPIVLLTLPHFCMPSSKRHAIVVILIVINNFFSSFNDANPSHTMWVDCCMLYSRECGPMSAVGTTPLPWSISSISFYLILPSYFI